MSVKQELFCFQQHIVRLRHELAQLKFEINSLQASITKYEEKAKTLEMYESPRAKEMAEEYRIEIEECQKAITQHQAREAVLQQEIENAERKISERKGDTTLYIQEQVDRMYIELIEYIDRYSKEIACNMKTTFHIAQKENQHQLTEVSIICVFDGDIEITETDEYCFHEPLYRKTGNAFGIILQKTPWYNKYCNDFREAFFKSLKLRWPYEEIFNLTIEGTTFTLELV